MDSGQQELIKCKKNGVYALIAYTPFFCFIRECVLKPAGLLRASLSVPIIPAYIKPNIKRIID